MALTSETSAACSIEGAMPADAVERSARGPLLLLIFCSMKWFAISAAFGVLAFVKLHAPGLLANVPFVTYGRVQPVFVDSLIYGFLTQAAVAVGLYLLCRLGRTTLGVPRLVIAATILWNTALAIGLAMVLAGMNSGLQLFEMPAGPFKALLVAFLAFSLSAFITNARRTVCDLYPSQWFILAAFLCFPWLLSSAIWALHNNTISPMAQPSVHQWYANGVLALWLVPIAIAAIYYFIPKLSGRVLASSGLAAFAFWTYFLFAGFGGFQFTSALPRWFPAVSSATAVLLLLPAAGNLMNWQGSLREKRKGSNNDRTWSFIKISAIAYLAATALSALAAIPSLNQKLSFSLYVPMLFFLTSLGVAGLALLGSIYYAVPRLTGVEWPKSVRFHGTLTLVGILLMIAALLIGGFVHASGLANTQKDFMSVTRSAFPFIGICTLSLLIILAGQLAGLGALMRCFYGCCCGSLDPKARSWRAKP